MVRGFLQVVVVLCLWGSDVSRAFSLQGHIFADGEDNPAAYAQGEDRADVRLQKSFPASDVTELVVYMSEPKTAPVFMWLQT